MSMTRIRTHKQSKFFIISNSTAQADYLGWESLGLLVYCLSMPENWEFKPKSIWKSRKGSRNDVYKSFDELIENYHCIRIREPNPKAKNLPGEVSYEIFDDQEDCKNRIMELEKQLEENKNLFFLTHAENFKNSFRRSDSRDTEDRDADFRNTPSWDNTKEDLKKDDSLEKKQQQPAAAFFKSLENIDVPDSLKIQISSKFSQEDVDYAVLWLTHPNTVINTTKEQALNWACKEKPKINVSKEERAEDNKAWVLEMIPKAKCPAGILIEPLNHHLEIGNRIHQPSCVEYKESGFKEKFKEAAKKWGIQL